MPKIKINPATDYGIINDEILTLFCEGANGKPDKTKFYWSIDLSLKPLIECLTDGNGLHIYVSNTSRKFLRVCPTCLQNVYEVEIDEILFGVAVLWDGANEEIELKER